MHADVQLALRRHQRLRAGRVDAAGQLDVVRDRGTRQQRGAPAVVGWLDSAPPNVDTLCCVIHYPSPNLKHCLLLEVLKGLH
jgi:hypothetical protein